MQRRALKISIGLIGLFVVSVSNVHAQTAQTEVIEPKSTSPFSIVRAIKQRPTKQTARWGLDTSYATGRRPNAAETRRRIPTPNIVEVDLSNTWKRLGIGAGMFETCSGDCDARIYQHELDGHRGREVILKLSIQWNTCRYLIFRKPRFRSRRWKLLGYIDHDFNRYQMASHRVVRAFGKPWLIVRGQEGSGSGYSLYGETWYEVSDSGVKPVLHYSQEGHTYSGPGGLDWELRARSIASTIGRARRPAIRLTFAARYTTNGFADSDFTKSFVNHRKAYYVWDKHRREFVFAPAYSTISEREMDAVANTGPEPPEADEGTTIGGNTFYSGLKGFVGSGFEIFLRLNAKRLHRVARNTGSPAQEWLREFLKQCDNVPEKLALERALQARLPHSQKQR